MTEFFAREWPTSAATWLPGGNAPAAKKLFCNPVLANTYQRIVDEAEAAGGNREATIEKARDAFYRGFVAEAIDRFCRDDRGDGHQRAPSQGIVDG